MSEGKDKKLAAVAWEGDSRAVVRAFPKAVRERLGADIFNLQCGERPLSYRPIPSVGQGVVELKQRDNAGWYRIVYLSRVNDTIYMLHAFKKQSAKMGKNDLALAKARLKAVLEAIREKKNG